MTAFSSIANDTHPLLARRAQIIAHLLHDMRATNLTLETYVTEASVVDIWEKESAFLAQWTPRLEQFARESIEETTQVQVHSATKLRRTANYLKSQLRSAMRNHLSIQQRSRLAQFGLIVHLDTILFNPEHRRYLVKNILQRKPEVSQSRYDAAKPTINLLNDAQLHLMARKIAAYFEQEFDRVDREIANWEMQTQGVEKRVAFISHLFPTTWSSLCHSLKKKDVKTIWLGTEKVDYFSGYGVVENDLAPIDAIITSPFWGVIYAMCQMPNIELTFNGECFYGPNWNFENSSFMYLLLTAVARTVKQFKHENSALTYIMYDGIKPIVTRAAGSVEKTPECLVTVLYKSFMHEAERIIFNSNGPIFSDFIQRTCDVTPKILNFYRYGEAPANHVERLPFSKDEIHMVCITVCLSEFDEPSRDAVDQYVQQIVESGIYFHYYCDETSPVIANFTKRVKPEFRKYFVPHPIQKNPAKLIEEISQYHVGFNPADHYAFARAIMGINCRFFRDAMACFLQSTYGTSFLVYCAAGLPCILPRGCVDAGRYLAPLAIPMNFSEFVSIPSLLKSNEFAALQKVSRQHAARYYCDAQIDRFMDFMWGNGNANTVASLNAEPLAA